MATLFDARITQVAPSQDDIQAVCVDGTYAWFSHSGNGGYISRVRQSDGVMIKSDGAPGDYTNARLASGMAGARSIATDGTYVLQIASTNQIARIRRCSDMSYVTDIALPTWGGGTQGVYAHGYFWFGVNNALVRITPGTWAGSSAATGSGDPYGMCSSSDGYIWTCHGTQYIRKFRASDNTLVATIDMGATVNVWSVDSDGTYLYILHWANPATYVWKMRLSDGLFWKTDFSGWTSNVGQGGFTVPLVWNGSSYLGFTRLIYASSYLYIANGHVGKIKRYATDVMAEAGSIDTAPSGRIPTGGTGAGPLSFAYDGIRIWSSNGLAVPSYVTSFESEVPAPTLQSVTPTGTGLDITLDTTLNVGSPTLGPPSAKLAVSGATQAGASVHLAIDPIAPKITTAKANTLGVDLVFDNEVSLAATPDYGTTVNNLRVVTANPLSTTEVQLFTTVTSGTYEWLAAPINVTGVGILPYVATAYARDMTTFVLIFSEAVVESSATNIGNYAISPALDILGIVKMNSTTYAMTTSQQTANTVYHVTLTGIIDPANNPI